MRLPVNEQPPSATSLSPRCESCVYRHDCGGLDDPLLLFNCFDILCCGTGKCDEVCPRHPKYLDRLNEVGGIRFDDLKPVAQKQVSLPSYVPHIPHQYSRTGVMHAPWVSVSPYQLMRRNGLAVDDEAGLRAFFGVCPDTQVIFRGVDEDASLERYWAMRKRDDLPQRFAALGPALFLAPNFSHFGDVPRTDNMWNRRRQLRCIEEMADAGLNAVPHLNDIVRGDWELWYSYLKDQPSIRFVCKEFQTRCRTRTEGLKAIHRMSELQHRLGRGLHPIIVGGAQFTEVLTGEFEAFTILDCRPVFAAFNRHRFTLHQGRVVPHPGRYLPGFGVDDLANENVAVYSRWIAHRTRTAVAAKSDVTRRAS